MYVAKDEASFSKKLYMNIENLKIMQNQGMIIGGHSYSHPWLEKLNYKQQELEIKLTTNFLKKIGVSLSDWVMCYPYGSYNNDTIKILKKNKCKMSFNTLFKKTKLVHSNRFSLERLDTNHFPKRKV